MRHVMNCLGSARPEQVAVMPSKNRRDLAADVPQRARAVSASRQRLTVDDLRRLAEACRDLVVPVAMARAWGDPDDTRMHARA
jgi:hypothetical protein